MIAVQTDYLFLGALIQQRLVEQLGSEVPVEAIEELAQAGDTEKRARVCYVLWGGDRFPDAAAGGAAQQIAQRWLVLLFVRNASRANGAARAGVAGPLLSRIQKALAGWQPKGATRPLRRVQGPTPKYGTDNGLFPLMFECDLYL